MKKLIIALTSFFLVMHACSAPSAKFDIKVVDNMGKPVEGAKVSVGFIQGGWPATDKDVDKKTDKKGEVVIEGKGASFGGMTIKKEGYYSGSNPYKFKKYDKILKRFLPYPMPVTVVLKKKRNPVPMYAKKNYWIKEMKDIRESGYDLKVGDWVSPLGEGEISDLIFTIDITEKDKLDHYTYKLSFSNKSDGIVHYEATGKDLKSRYTWPFLAPEIGYKKGLDLGKKIYKKPLGIIVQDDSKKYKKLIFRVRTKVNNKGEIESANYGKISGLEFMGHKIKFTYYFNPDGTRNLEFDPKKNLLKLPKYSKHEVQAP